MTSRRAVFWMLLLAVIGPGCSTVRVVRLETGDEAPFIHVPYEEDGAGAVELDDDEFQEAVVELARDVRTFRNPLREARERMGVPQRGSVYWYERRNQQFFPVGEDTDGPSLLTSYSDEGLTRDYGRWCERKRQPGDCLRLLDEGPLLASDGKYTLALAIAMDSVWDETAGALKGLADPQALMATVTASVSMYLLLWALPEPVSKGIAALVTATAIAYLGVDTVWRLLDGWVSLARAVELATTFEQLSDAGEAYGAVLGKNAARIFVMLATAAIGNTAGLAAKASRLPGSAKAALAVESQAGYAYVSAGSVRSVAMSAEGFTLALAPNAVAMAARGTGSGSRTQKHHLATIRNEKSAARGGPWTPRFRKLFKKAGMELKDPENVVPIKGHQGPHPQEYHQTVYRELLRATEDCSSMASCRKALTDALKTLAKEVATPGTELNLLITQGAVP